MRSRMLERDESCRKGQSNSEKQHIWSTRVQSCTRVRSCTRTAACIIRPITNLLRDAPMEACWAFESVECGISSANMVADPKDAAVCRIGKTYSGCVTFAYIW